MNKEDTLKQICKMIASGEIPDEVYNKYLSKTPIGFMNKTDLYNFLKGKNNKISDETKGKIAYCISFLVWIFMIIFPYIIMIILSK